MAGAPPFAVVGLKSHRAGENSQIRALVEALEETLSLSAHWLTPAWKQPKADLLGFLCQASFAGTGPLALPRAKRHLIVSAGLRNEPIARALAQVSPQGHTVFLGRTWAPADAFSLTVTTPQYRVPPHPRVHQNALTLHGLTGTSLAAAAREEGALLGPSSGQALAILVGGASGPYALGPRAAKRLLEEAHAIAGERPLWLTTSPRTQKAAVAVFAAHPWRPEDRYLPFGAGPNPYRAMLAKAGALLVTGDSIAMLSEAAGTGKPLRIFDLGAMAGKGSGRPRDYSLASLAYAALFHLGPRRLSRDLRCVYHGLLADPQVAFSPTPIAPAAWGKGIARAPQLAATLARLAELGLTD